METEGRRSRYQQLIDALRPEAKAAPLSRRAVRADVVLAVVLAVVALFVAVRHPGDGPVNVNPPAVDAGTMERLPRRAAQRDRGHGPDLDVERITGAPDDALVTGAELSLNRAVRSERSAPPPQAHGERLIMASIFI
ncbi:hypothetical protein [Streptomyces sp. Wb2n-11]|uniref:hypothetical protein n=1 Tax=Streptomyces sp. Wb2n-11 TaxID=1030533 RepID=UPI000AE21D08|nr:hypothetical protein [Streptomyces sp. Wb2n-11]